MEELERLELLIGNEKLNKLINSKVIIFGCGGVGGYTVEALARSGIKNITIVDKDKVSISNINRQIIALHSTVGLDKVDVLETRIKDINPLCNVIKFKEFYLPDNSNFVNLLDYDYVIDCIDTVSAKLDIIEKCVKNNINIISAMGMGNKLDPTKIEIADISKTSICPLARTIRYELRKRDIRHLKVIYSKEEPLKPIEAIIENGKTIPGSNSFVPSVAGLIIASEVIKDLIK